MKEKYLCGFIGAGNMGSAIAKAVSKKCGGNCVFVCDRHKEKTDRLKNECNCVVSSAEEICRKCDFIFLAVKPDGFCDTAESMMPFLSERKSAYTVVSMAAGITVKEISKLFGENASVIRIMPNTPCSVGSGMTVFDFQNTDDGRINAFKEIFEYAGRLEYLDESLIDAAGAVSGCGPAFAYMFIESLADGAVECGLPRDKAVMLAAQTVLGAADTVLKTKKHTSELKDEVCSPKGTTIEGVRALEKGKMRAAVMDAVIASYEKTAKLK